MAAVVTVAVEAVVAPTGVGAAVEAFTVAAEVAERITAVEVVEVAPTLLPLAVAVLPVLTTTPVRPTATPARPTGPIRTMPTVEVPRTLTLLEHVRPDRLMPGTPVLIVPPQRPSRTRVPLRPTPDVPEQMELPVIPCTET
jgi:hypothetical protein